MYSKIKLGTISKIGGGKRVPKGENLLTEDTGYRYIRARDIHDGIIEPIEDIYISESTFNKIKNYRIFSNDICVTIAGNIGFVAFVNDKYNGVCLTENAAKIKIINADFIPRYVYYCLSSVSIKREMENIAAGSAQPKLGLYKLKELDIFKPPILSQQKIASILSSYDDLIENNNKRIKILEQITESIYKEWFVNFKFPGYEKIKMVDSELGKIPEGWKITSLISVSNLITRGPSLNYEGGSIPVLNQRCVRNGEIELDTIQYSIPLSENKKYLYLSINDILINSMGVGTLGRVSRNLSIDYPMIIHNCITVVRTNELKLSQYLGYYYVKDKEKIFESLSVGATGQTSLKPVDIGNQIIIIPDKFIQTKFENIVSPNWKLIGKLKLKNNHLKELKNILLPKLISGELDVENLDIKIRPEIL